MSLRFKSPRGHRACYKSIVWEKPGQAFVQGDFAPLVNVFSGTGGVPGRLDLTQKWVRWVMDTKYGDDYVGLDGNDDGGTLSAWYVWSALGLYPIAGTTRYELGAPLFEEAEARIGKATLKIVAANYAPENIYARSVSLNDKPLDRTWVTHDEIGEGGVLKFEMAGTPQ